MRWALVVAFLWLAGGARPAEALRLPLRSYGAADGLEDAGVDRVRIGPGDFVWVATRGGLWRFDGERFDVLAAADGVPRGEVFDFAFAQDGSLWIASEAGLFHGDPARVTPGRPAFSELRLEDATHHEMPHRIATAADGTIWVGSFEAVWHLVPGTSGIVAQRFTLLTDASAPATSRIQALAVDPSGSVWVGTHAYGVYRLSPSGRIDHCGSDGACNFVRDFFFDGEGGVWAAYLGGVARFDAASFGTGAAPTVDLRPQDGLPGIDTELLVSTGPDHLLLASTAGITAIDRDPPGRWRVGPTIDRRSGLPGDDVGALALDPAGNLWIGFSRGGLAKRIAGGFTVQDDAEEAGARIVALTRDRQGRLVVLSQAGALRWTIHVVARDRTETHHLPLPKGVGYVGWGRQQLIAQEAGGAWWIAAGGGALKYGASAAGSASLDRPPGTIVDMSRGLPSSDIYVLFLDRAGDLWFSASTPPDTSGVACLRHGARSVERFTKEEIGSTKLAVGFAEDAEGQLWIAFTDGTVVRRRGGRFERIASPLRQLDAAPFVLDTRGRLWILGDGLAVIDRPGEERPAAVAYATPETLAGTSFTTGVDDGHGTLYLGTPRGVLRLDPDSGRERLLTAADGLVPGIVQLSARDADGVLWFSDGSGLSRFTPGPERPLAHPAPRIREVRVAGIPTPVPVVGAASIGPLTIPPAQRSIEIGYFAVHTGPGAPPLFQHRLIGTDAEWSAPTASRRVLYAGLAPGRYRFGVRAVATGGAPASEPAIVEFRVLAPFWLRGWFVALALLGAGAAVYGAHRMRVARAVAIERVRTRIATDLHDEVGSSLAQISVLSQVAERDAVRASGSAPRGLSRIAELARGVTDSMGETVWAISPREDRLSDLVHRMRRFALDLFADGESELALDLPAGGSDERLDPEIRRTLYLVFKEALHNTRKHAAAAHVRVALHRERGGLVLRVGDDGRGFDPAASSTGHGLDGMRRRAEAIGGRVELRSRPSGGAEIVFRAPLSKTGLFRRTVGRRGGRA